MVAGVIGLSFNGYWQLEEAARQRSRTAATIASAEEVMGMLRDAETYAFELLPDSLWRHSGVDPRNVAGRNLAPQGEFDWPEGVRPLSTQRSTWAPGAYQR
jgi:hypothetical protein